jgi:hypothetical protein
MAREVAHPSWVLPLPEAASGGQRVAAGQQAECADDQRGHAKTLAGPIARSCGGGGG